MEKIPLENRDESRIRSVVKSVVWRGIGIAVLAMITYAFTRSWMQTGLITFLHHFVFIFVFYLHERLWLKPYLVKIVGLKRKILRTFLYEIVLGQSILAFITFMVTWMTEGVPSIQKMTSITWAYIGNKLWIYVVYDWVWNKKIIWGVKTEQTSR